VWKNIYGNIVREEFWNSNIQEWLISNIIGVFANGDKDWSGLFGLVVDGIWRSRNESIFSRVTNSVQSVVAMARKL
jgi:hypothetical protein